MLNSWKPSRRQFLTGLLTTGAALGCTGQVLARTIAMPKSGSFPSETAVKLEAALDSSFKRARTPGVVAGIWQGDKHAWTSLRGDTEMKGGVPATFDLHTRVGSITKTMVGTMILQLVDEGRLGIDDTVEKWFPKLPLANEITIRMLGTMASGIASYTLSDEFTNEYFAHPERAWKEEDLLDLAYGLKREFPPGKGFQYCNTNFVMLGVLVEKLRDQPLGQAMQEHLFKPLGMNNSSFPSGTDLPEPYWHGYTLQGTDSDTPVDATHWSPTFGAGAGQVVCNFDDLRIWARALGTGALLKPATLALRLEHNSYSVKGNRAYDFGVGNENGWIAHAGTLPGYNTQVAYLPKQDLSLVVMANSDLKGDDGIPAVAVFNALTAVISPDNSTA